jgi:hypothetical protein
VSRYIIYPHGSTLTHGSNPAHLSTSCGRANESTPISGMTCSYVAKWLCNVTTGALGFQGWKGQGRAEGGGVG